MRPRVGASVAARIRRRTGPGEKKLQTPRSLPLCHIVLCLLQGRLPSSALRDFEKLAVERTRLSFVTQCACCPSGAKQAVETPGIKFNRALVRRERVRRVLLLIHKDPS